MISITVIDMEGNWYEYSYQQPFPRLSIGRHASNGLILHDDVISSRHGEFFYSNNQLYYRDLGSSNGTTISASGKQKKLFQSDAVLPLPSVCVLRVGSEKNISRQVMILVEQHSVTSSNTKGWSLYPLSDGRIKIGSDSTSMITLPFKDPNVHAFVEKRGKDTIIQPGNRGVQILVNGIPVLSEKAVADNDLLEINGQIMIYSRGRILFRPANRGLPLQGMNITKTVSGKWGKKKKILDQVCVSIEPNQFTAIIGGSGAGKTTLMNALSGFEPEFDGDSLIGGSSLKQNFNSLKHLIGFVPQQDILYETLTLKKMLLNAAKLRMDCHTSKEERSKRVDSVLGMVDLSEHANTVISKLSGGQKKRASIAVELLSDPKIFFLDEPSSGLDPGTEKSLMVMLNHLAREQKKTIVMVTHNISNLNLCDQVIFMERGGRLAFAGPAGMAREYFQTPDLTDVYLLLNEDSQGHWAARFRKEQPNPARYSPDSTLLEPAKPDSFFHQLGIFLDRYMNLLLRDHKKLLLLLIQPFAIALLLVFVSSEDMFDLFNDTQSMLFSLSCSAIWIGLFNTIQEICKERVIVKREYMSKLRLVPYLSAKFLISAVLGLIQAVILGTVYLSFQTHQPTGIFLSNPYPEVLFTLWLTILASESLGFVVSSLAKSGDKAMTYAPFLLIIQLIFSGILFKLKGLGDVIASITISKWSVQALGATANLNSLATTFEQDYPNLGIEREVEAVFEHTISNLLTDWGMLLLISTICFGFTLFFLRRIKKDRR